MGADRLVKNYSYPLGYFEADFIDNQTLLYLSFKPLGPCLFHVKLMVKIPLTSLVEDLALILQFNV